MSSSNAKFDGLAEQYERVRPRYPDELFSHAVGLLGPARITTVVDAGAGTGIGLDALLPLLSEPDEVHAVDVSADMVELGRRKYPGVSWHVGEVEPYLETVTSADLVVAAQAYQWLDRPRFLRAAAAALGSNGVCFIVQNNRDYTRSGFLHAYESLLEANSPGYSRDYRSIDVVAELSGVFAHTQERTSSWTQHLPVSDFVDMSSSSTQAQRAVQAIGPGFLEQVRELAEANASNGVVDLPYRSEGFYGRAQA